jgi:hypothetical protein
MLRNFRVREKSWISHDHASLNAPRFYPRHLSAAELLDSFAGGPLGVFHLAFAVALLAEIPTIEQLVPELVQRQAAAGGMFRPRHISAVEIAAVDGIGMKFSERLDACALSASSPLRAYLLLARCFALVIFRDAGKELDCARVNASGR